MKRLTIVLEDAEADPLLKLVGSSWKQSELLGQLIREANARRCEASGANFAGHRLQMIGVAQELQSVARQLSRQEGMKDQENGKIRYGYWQQCTCPEMVGCMI